MSASPARIADFSVAARSATLRGSIFHSGPAQPPRVLSLHGGGRTTQHGIRYLLCELARHDVSCAAFDFSGHGDSSGEVEGSSLSERVDQALAVVAQVPLRPSVALMATSMGGHIACSLIERLDPPALVLFCPAAYAFEAQNAPFGPAFQRVLRSTVDHASSPAFSALEKFKGRLLLVYGTADTVIPVEVLAQYEHRAINATRLEVIRLPGVGHKVHDWLREHPAEHSQVLDAIRETLRE